MLPAGPLSLDDVERLWRRDRASLERCGVTLDTLVAHYQRLGSELAGARR